MKDIIPVEKIIVLSSIPGRIRVKINYFNDVDFFKEKIINSLSINKVINKIKVNDYLNTVLVFYNCDLSDESNIISLITQINLYDENINLNISESKKTFKKMIFKAFNPINLIKKYYDKDIYCNQYNASKSLIKTGVALSAAVLMYSYSMKTIFSILLLSYPGFLFVISSSAYYLSHKIAFANNVFSANLHSFKKLSDSNSIAIDSSLLLNKDKKYNDFYTFNGIKSIINNNMSIVIRDLRNLGIIDLRVLFSRVDHLLEKVIYTLGLEPLTYANQSVDEFKKKSPDTFIIKYKSVYPLNEVYDKFIVFAYDDNDLLINKQTQNIYIHEQNITKIPFLIHLTRHIDQLIIQTQSIAITVNIFGMLLAVYGFISITGCIILYLCNVLFSSVLLTRKTYIAIG
jgi:hypothetical protein